MQNLMILCPNTEKPADTGHTLSTEDLKAAVFEDRAFECGQCGEMHLWSKSDLIQA